MGFTSQSAFLIVILLLGIAIASSILTWNEQRTKRPEHILIPCNDTFEATRAALEEVIPPLDYTYRTHLKSGNNKATLEALRRLPRFNNFTDPPRDFGSLLDVVGKHGVKAVQYQVGNPHTATTMVKYEVGAGLFLPITVLLRVDADGVVAFEYVSPSSMMRQLKLNHPALHKAANQLDRELLDTLSQIAGWDRPGRWTEPRRR